MFSVVASMAASPGGGWTHPIETDTLVDTAVQQWEFGNMSLEVLAHTDGFRYIDDDNSK